MLVLITGLHVLHGPQPSLIKTSIEGEAGVLWARLLPDGIQAIIKTLPSASAVCTMMLPVHIKAAQHAESQGSVNYMSDNESFVIRFKNDFHVLHISERYD